MNSYIIFFKHIIFITLLFSSNVHSQELLNGDSIFGTILNEDQTDIYNFDAQAGETIILSLGGELNGFMEVFDPDGGPAIIGTSSFNNPIVLDQTGTYTVVVQPFNAVSTGDYELFFVKAPGANEHGTLINGGVHTETITDGDLDSYTFDGQAGDTVIVSLGGELSGFIYVFDPDGGPAIIGTSSFNNPIVLDQTGTYTVVVQPFNAVSTGDYELFFVKAPGANEHGTLTNGGVHAETITDGDLDSYTFDGQAGDTVIVSLGGELSGFIYVFDPDGGPAIIGTSSFNNPIVLDQTGTYTVVVQPFNAVSTGDYELFFVKAPGANEHGTLTNGGVHAETITDGDLDSYTFEAQTGDMVSLSLGGALNGFIYVFNPDGGPAIISTSSFNNPIELDQTGIYTVVVQPFNAVSTGNYTLEFDLDPQISYAALGDSFSSGEGVPPYEAGTEGEGCRRSELAYSKLINNPGTNQTISGDNNSIFDFYACTGAVINNVRFPGGTSHKGEPPPT